LARNRFDGASIDIPCPHCGRKTAQSMSWMQSHAKMTCPWCKKSIDLTTADLRAAVGQAQKGLNRVQGRASMLGERS
jgi:phage FluMu protein Com